MAKRITAVAIENMKPGVVRRELPAGGGLFVVVQPSGKKGFCLRYRFGGRTRRLVLQGGITLAQARKLASDAMFQLAQGIDPAIARRDTKQRAAAAQADTIDAHVRQFIERHVRQKTRKGTQGLYERILRNIVLPAWSGRSVHSVARRDVIALIEGVAEGDKETPARPILANRVLATLSRFFSWLCERDQITASPCTGVKRPTAETTRERTLSEDEIKRLWLACDGLDGRMAACVRLMLLLGQRRNEIYHMPWAEIENGVWVLPPARTKNGRRHEVPLPSQALAIIEGLPRVGDYVLRPLGNLSPTKIAIDAAMKPATRWTYHDLRRTCASGMSRLGVPVEVIERCLNHASGSFRGIVGTYQRDPLTAAKRNALQKWTDHVDAVVHGEPAGKVVKLRG
jgi:integrase